MSGLHEYETMKDGTIKITFCPYERTNAYGHIDEGGCNCCNSYYCGDGSKTSEFHRNFMDCIIELVESNYWGKNDATQFEEYFKYKEKATWLQVYEILKREKCQMTEKTHKLAEVSKNFKRKFLTK